MAVDVAAPTARPWPAQLFLLALRWGLAGVFIAAAVPKIAAPDLFASDIFNYQMLPPWGVNALAVGLPWLELVVGVCLGLGIWTRASALIIGALMVVFMIALASAASRGLDISCGCFEVGAEGGHGSLLWAALRDVAFLAAALLLLRYPDAPHPLAWIHKARAGREGLR